MKPPKLRWPFLVVAIALSLVIVLFERGAPQLEPLLEYLNLAQEKVNVGALLEAAPDTGNSELDEALNSVDEKSKEALSVDEDPPGRAIPAMAFVDIVLCFSVSMLGAALVMGNTRYGRLQGLLTMGLAICLILVALVEIYAALAAMIKMTVLLFAFPFGTIIYMCRYASFDRSGAAVILSLLMLLKIGVGGSILLAEQDFLKNLGLVVIFFMALVANVIVVFLHSLVPRFLVSITDAVGGIVMGVIGIVLVLILAIFGIISLIMSLPGLIPSLKK